MVSKIRVSGALRAVLLAAAPLAFGGPAGAADVPLAVYGDLPAVEDVALSPGGGRIAVASEIKGERWLLFLDAGMNVLRSAKLGDVKLRGLDWMGEDAVLVTTSETEPLGLGFTTDTFEARHVAIMTVAPQKKLEFVFGNEKAVTNAVFGQFGERRIAGHWFGYYGGVALMLSAGGSRVDHARPTLYAVDLEKNAARKLAPPPAAGYWRDWVVGGQGEVAATMDVNRDTGEWKLAGPKERELARGKDVVGGGASLAGLGTTGSTAIYRARGSDDDAWQWFEVPLDGSAAPSAIFAGMEVDTIYSDSRDGHMIGYRPHGDAVKPVLLDSRGKALLQRITQTFAGRYWNLIGWNDDFDRAIVWSSGSADSGGWYLIDLAHGSAELIGQDRPGLPPEKVGPVSTFAYTAADGLEMDGILTLPPGRAAKGLPVVVFPHGGPASKDDPLFDWWAQAFASRGYAVFQPNFRGSTNRDAAFRRAGDGEWGRKMQSDISDGLAALATAGIVDPKRACIMGGSYGGYAALAGVTVQQGLYRCAVSVGGISDIGRHYASNLYEEDRAGVIKLALQRQLGPSSGFDAISPRHFAARADAPILLIHGRDDTVVPFEQSRIMADALKDAGKPYQFVELKSEDHWLSRAETRKQMLEAAVAFVQRYNPAE
ncbi:MAG: prolyl oligopeptidase family serine peptidase [Candidatus Andeanibacterium colombiense]|uniref:Prolyl oligopeptidase family serine peptidase n=1 Tax=Candidatus Andeanibacterium colombiense TaxID=3121345 RepID=A0AAJ5X3C2_9SPHN|nr:MAG: prolyl oligopeptidase family serine peptidase [Sphingomonadaceae bacterium]